MKWMNPRGSPRIVRALGLELDLGLALTAGKYAPSPTVFPVVVPPAQQGK